MIDRDLMRGAIWSALAALVVFLIPDAILERFVVATGISSIIPAAAPPLGTTASLLLAAAVFIIGLALTSLLGRTGDEWETGEGYGEQADPLPAAEQTTASPMPIQTVVQTIPQTGGDDLHARLSRIEAVLATLSGQIQAVVKASPGADLGKTLRSVQALLRNPPTDPVLLEAVRSVQGGQGGPDAVLARIEALEARINERFAEMSDRLAATSRGPIDAGYILPLPKLPTRRPTGAAAQRISRTLADIRRSIEKQSA